MTTTEYADYQKRVTNFLTTNRVKPGCYSEVDGERTEFTSRPCECCRRHWAGSRERYSFATEPLFETFTADICSDCVYYLAYGQLDDLTMFDMKEA